MKNSFLILPLFLFIISCGSEKTVESTNELINDTNTIKKSESLDSSEIMNSTDESTIINLPDSTNTET